MFAAGSGVAAPPGDASDAYSRLQAAALLNREAIEVNDTLIQGMAAAKWSIEAGRVETGLQTLDRTMAQAQEMVSDMIRRAGMGGRSAQLS